MAGKREPEPADYTDVVRALKARGFGADVWGTGGGIDAVAATIDGEIPNPDRRHLLITCTDGDWLVGIENGVTDHDLTELSTSVMLVNLPIHDAIERRHPVSTATASEVADTLADLVVSLLGPANIAKRGARRIARPRRIGHSVRVPRSARQANVQPDE
jgi:hypothetical protein